MKAKEIDKDTKVVDILEYGQGYDDEIAKIFEAFNKFRDGYYELTNYGDDWWKVFNQNTMFDEMMQTQWSEIEKIDMSGVIEKMAKAMIGTYVRFDMFAKVVIDADKNKMGFRHEEKQNEQDK
ncbi:MAG: hypothetical protein IKE77_00805 [Erysipelotrichaceae bacterium]|nr:hypothetical protein [Erysipelotrichaceae bacterium]